MKITKGIKPNHVMGTRIRRAAGVWFMGKPLRLNLQQKNVMQTIHSDMEKLQPEKSG